MRWSAAGLPLYLASSFCTLAANSFLARAGLAASLYNAFIFWTYASCLEPGLPVCGLPEACLDPSIRSGCSGRGCLCGGSGFFVFGSHNVPGGADTPSRLQPTALPPCCCCFPPGPCCFPLAGRGCWCAGSGFFVFGSHIVPGGAATPSRLQPMTLPCCPDGCSGRGCLCDGNGLFVFGSHSVPGGAATPSFLHPTTPPCCCCARIFLAC